MTCPLHLPTPHEIAGALRCCDRATLQATLCPRPTLDMHALSGHAARWGQFRAGFGSLAPALAWTTALIPALASVGAPWRLPRLLAALASLPLTVGGKHKASYYAFSRPRARLRRVRLVVAAPQVVHKCGLQLQPRVRDVR